MIEPEGEEAESRAALAHAADRGRLLPDEPEESTATEDVEHWIAVYRELVAFNRELIELVERRLTAEPGGESGPEPAELQLLKAHLERLSRRLERWTQARLASRPLGVS